MPNTNIRDNVTKLAALCEQSRADFESYQSATRQLAGNSMLSESGRQSTQAKLDASWREQRGKLIADASAIVEEIYNDERNAEIGFLVNPNVTEAVALIDRLADTLDARAIREIGLRFIGEQAPLHCLAEYMKKKGIPSERVDSALGPLTYPDSLLLEMRDAISQARVRNAGGAIDCMAENGAVTLGAASILNTFEKPEPVTGNASRRLHVMF